MSSKRHQRRRACEGKRRFKTRNLALASLCTINKRHPRGFMTAYRCKFCGGFHFGHPPRRVKQAIRARRALVNV